MSVLSRLKTIVCEEKLAFRLAYANVWKTDPDWDR